MIIAVCDLQFKDIETQLNETMWKHEFPKPNFKGFMTNNAQINCNMVIIVYGSGDPFVKMVDKNCTYLFHYLFNLSINKPNNWSNLNCKMSTRFFAISARMPHPLGKLIIIMFYFIVGGFHLGLFLRQVSTSLVIGLTFGIFMLHNGRFHGPCEYFFCEFPMTSLFFCPFKIVRCQFSLKFHL
jgi:hypothetical protein